MGNNRVNVTTYGELITLDDDKLAMHGYARNERGGITRIRAGARGPDEPPDQSKRRDVSDAKKCSACESAETQALLKNEVVGQKTTGIASLIRAKTGDKVDERTKRTRMALCVSCQETAHGTTTRLYREKDGMAYCGEPRSLLHPTSIVRDERAEGCGCELHDKTRWWRAKCPRDRWGEGPIIGTSAHVVSPVKRPQQVLPGVIDVRVRSVDSTQYTGIGDYISAIPVVHAIAVARDERVRMRAIESRVEWAQLGWPDVSIDHDETDIGETVIDINKYGSSELDIMLEERGQTRQDYWFEVAGVPPFRPKVDIEEPARKWVDEQLLNTRRAGKRIIICAPFANVVTRQWPLHHWIDLVEELTALGHYVATIDSDPQRGRYIPCQRFWGWKPSHVMALIAAADLYVGNDSGMTHIAGITETPSVAICSATSAHTVFGWYRNMTGIQATGLCSSCLWRKERGFRRSCHTQCAAMWDGAPVERVLDACVRRLETARISD